MKQFKYTGIARATPQEPGGMVYGQTDVSVSTVSSYALGAYENVVDALELLDDSMYWRVIWTNIEEVYCAHTVCNCHRTQ